MMLLPCLSAHAGHWSLTASGSCTAYINGNLVNPQTWKAPSGAFTNSISLSSYEINAGGYGYPQYHTVGTGSVQYTISAMVAGIWIPDNGNDPAPPSVLLEELSRGYYKTISGTGTPTANDGLTPPDAVVLSSDSTYTQIGTSGSPGWHYFKKTGASWTESFTISASASASNANGFASAVAGFGNLLLSVHAQPYNWHIITAKANWNGENQPGQPQAGTLYFIYDWLSTSGRKDDLTECFSHEIVTYPGANPYQKPVPFVNHPPGLPNPTIAPGVGGSGSPMTNGFQGQDNQLVWDTIPPYVGADISASQSYVFDDTATGERNVTIPSSDGSSTATIRRLISYSGGAWTYYCIKSGITGSKTLQVGP